jgi:hypothetical protein
MCDCAVAWMVSHQLCTLKGWVLSLGSSCRTCGESSGTGAGFPLSTSVFPCQSSIPPVLHTHLPSEAATVDLF